MSESGRLLLATDFGQAADAAAEQTIALARALDAEVAQVHVITTAWRAWFSGGMLERQVQQRFDAYARRLAQHGVRNAGCHVEQGSVADTILLIAERIAATMIIMGAGEKSLLDLSFTGSSAEAVARAAPLPVWISKRAALPRHVLCAVDGGPAADRGLTLAVQLARKVGSRLTLLHVLPDPKFNPMGMAPEDVERETEAHRQARIDELERSLSAHDFQGLEVQRLYHWGATTEVILAAAKDHACDLLVIGSTGNGGLKHAIMGNTAEKVLRRASSSLLVVK